MIIFYIKQDGTVDPTTGVNMSGSLSPVVIINALDSSDRFSEKEIIAAAQSNAPEAGLLAAPAVYSCLYEYEYSHNGIPLGEGIKTQFSGIISSPPAALVAKFSPKYFTSAQSIDQMADVLSNIANPQTTITHAAIVEKDQTGIIISRKFIAYSAQVIPDTFGATTTMAIHGAAISDLLIKSEVAYMLSKDIPLSTQLTDLLQKAGYQVAFQTQAVYKNPVAGKLFQPMAVMEVLDEICIQNKLIPAILNNVVTIYSQTDKPYEADVAKFSFLGYSGALAWAIGVENYANIKFKTSFFDARLFQPITVYNDIQSEFFSGLAKNGGVGKYDAYGANIIRYSIRRTAEEIITEVTATNNWLLSQVRVDGILESSVYAAAL